jgi:hypothetical protein
MKTEPEALAGWMRNPALEANRSESVSNAVERSRIDGLHVVGEPEHAPIRSQPCVETLHESAFDSSLDAARGIGLGILLGALCWAAVFAAAALVLAS